MAKSQPKKWKWTYKTTSATVFSILWNWSRPREAGPVKKDTLYMHERGRKRVDFLSSLQRTALKWKRLGKRKCILDSAAFEPIDQRKMAMKRRSGQGGQKGEERQNGKGTNCGAHFTYKLSVRIRYEHNHAISTTNAWNVFKLKKKIKLKK